MKQRINENNNHYNERCINYIKKVVADYYKVDFDIYDTRSRKRENINVKHTAIYFCYRNLKITTGLLGTYFNVDHASVIHISKKMTGLLEWDKTLIKEYRDLQQLIDIKGNPNGKKIVDIDAQYYFINLDDVKSVKPTKSKAIIFSGYETDEVEFLIKRLSITDCEVMSHKKTGMFIMERLKNNINENNNDGNNSTNETTTQNN